MSGITMPWYAFRNFLGDLVGIRVGLGLDDNRLDAFLVSSLKSAPDTDAYVRMHPQNFEYALFTALQTCGDRWTEMGPVPRGEAIRRLNGQLDLYGLAIELIHRQVHLQDLAPNEYAHHKEDASCLRADSLPPHTLYGSMDMFALNSDLVRFNPAPLLGEASVRGGAACRHACELVLHAYRCEQRLNPWRSHTAEVSAAEIAKLSDLFEASDTPHSTGAFFDQRFVDFLCMNLEDLPRIHWRQFERLVAEYLHRQGYSVQLGPGHNDDGVDVRVWPTDADQPGPPLMIVQCKRQALKVPKVVVKGLWADMQSESAMRGLVATTSTLSAGASQTIKARGYGIDLADGDAIADWIHVMRTPGVGPSLA